jgi:ribonuclease HI
MEPNRFHLHGRILITSNPTLGAFIVNPRNHTTTHIEIKSQPERHTINRAELAAITITLEANRHDHTLSILTDTAFSINIIRRYAIESLGFIHHPHKNLLQLADNIIHTRDNMGYRTHIDKVKSHTGVTHNDEADTAARNVVEGHKNPDIKFTDAGPPLGGLRTWPQTRKNGKGTPPIITKLADLHSSLHKLIRTHTSNITRSHDTIYSQILNEARITGSDHTIHAYSTTPFRARRDSLEVTWEVHIHRCKRKDSPSLICSKC